MLRVVDRAHRSSVGRRRAGGDRQRPAAHRGSRREQGVDAGRDDADQVRRPAVPPGAVAAQRFRLCDRDWRRLLRRQTVQNHPRAPPASHRRRPPRGVHRVPRRGRPGSAHDGDVRDEPPEGPRRPAMRLGRLSRRARSRGAPSGRVDPIAPKGPRPLHRPRAHHGAAKDPGVPGGRGRRAVPADEGALVRGGALERRRDGCASRATRSNVRQKPNPRR
mmetsp:Transcript_4530/g.16985  ORF Transcript_4530/g.16985 Transcript_4530/m.16985 type:complete len:219 (+) Transcript_4530:263-919(+)